MPVPLAYRDTTSTSSRMTAPAGHVLDCAASHASIRACSIADFRVALPETVEFLRADLSRDPNADLAAAERMHPK
jgi:hypothetical protein